MGWGWIWCKDHPYEQLIFDVVSDFVKEILCQAHFEA